MTDLTALQLFGLWAIGVACWMVFMNGRKN